ncbi:MAG TPA: hypothetical protein VF646_00885 [Cytophagales bacterium]
MEKAKRLQEVSDDAAARERDRLARKYGPDHPRVQKLTARLSYNQKLFAGLDAEIERARVPTTPLAGSAWRVHGRVYDRQNVPLKGHTMFLADESGKGANDLPYACSDERGHYEITVAEAQLRELKQKKVYLAVAERNREVLYRATDPLAPTRGVIDYQDVCLGGEECAPPPSGAPQ